MGSTQSDVGRGSFSITITTTGASDWRKLRGVYNKFSMQSLPSTATTAFAATLQGTISTDSTTPTELIAITALTGAASATTEAIPFTHVRVYSSVLSSGSVVSHIAAMD